jgi:hypothetical protein
MFFSISWVFYKLYGLTIYDFTQIKFSFHLLTNNIETRYKQHNIAYSLIWV